MVLVKKNIYIKETCFTVAFFLLGFLCGYFLTNMDIAVTEYSSTGVWEIFKNNISIVYLNILFGICTLSLYSNVNLLFQGIGMGAVIKTAILNDMGMMKVLSAIAAHGFMELLGFFLANILVIRVVLKLYHIIVDKNKIGRLVLLRELAIKSVKAIVIITIIILLAAIVEGTITRSLYNGF